jgi:hypothetical protein
MGSRYRKIGKSAFEFDVVFLPKLWGLRTQL